jgi:hypothetical protein
MGIDNHTAYAFGREVIELVGRAPECSQELLVQGTGTGPILNRHSCDRMQSIGGEF